MSTEVQANRLRGQTSYHAGISAEAIVLRAYQDCGYRVLATRWRGQGGEIDLIVLSDCGIVFVEVKKSSSFATAALRITPRQQMRLIAAAEEFVATQPAGLLSDMRFDVALVDAVGRIEIIENALFEG